MSQRVAFRADINFLRAIAVLSVLLFHFNVWPFSGGFAGVDVFFVITGYLMAEIICGSLETRSFSLIKFYVARVRRILPALIVLCIFCLSLGWFLLTPEEYYSLAIHANDSILFVSNTTYRNESGYFDPSLYQKWLLHTWSLSVEWQFYMLFPLVVYLLFKLIKSKNFLFLVIFIITILFFALAIYGLRVSKESAFYMLEFRCWEMLAGSVVYLYGRTPGGLMGNQAQRSLALLVTGLALISYSVIFLDRRVLWPGWYSLLPVLGAALVLFAKADLKLFHWRIINGLGLRSYSLYLWHWPFVILLTYWGLENDTLWLMIAIISSVLMACLSYRFIEEPFRRSKWPAFGVVALVALMAIAVMAWTDYIKQHHGFPQRFSTDMKTILAVEKDITPKLHECMDRFSKNEPPCVFGGDDVKAIVVGDSHAHSVVSAVASVLPSVQGVEFWGRIGCPIIANLASDDACQQFNELILQKVKSNVSKLPLIIINRWSIYPFGDGLFGLDESSLKPMVHFGRAQYKISDEFLASYRKNVESQLCELAKYQPTYVLLPIPEYNRLVPREIVHRAIVGNEQRITLSRAHYLQRHQFMIDLLEEVAHKCRIGLLDPVDVMCDEQACYADYAGKPLYYDDDHLSDKGNKILAPLFRSVLSK